MIRIACDVHTHTIFSRHAYSTLEEDVRAASAKNLELLGVTDHFSCMLFDQRTSSTSRGICSAGTFR